MCLLMLLWLPHVISALSGPLAPVNVKLESANFNHILRWDRGTGALPGVTYRVTFSTDRGPCCGLVVLGCERLVAPLVCNLTEAFSDPEHIYHIMVTAQLGSMEFSTSIRDFQPIRDTKLEPPVLRVALCESGVCVDMDAPLPHLHSIYNSSWYQLKVQSSNSPHAMVKSPQPSLHRQTFSGLGTGSQFCFSVRFADDITPRHSDFSSPQCVHIPFSASLTEFLLASTFCIAAVIILIGVVLLYWTGFFCFRKLALPSVLNSLYHSAPRLEVVCHPPVSSLLIVETAPPPTGRTGSCSSTDSNTDSSEDEEDVENQNVADRGDAISHLYTTKASFSSSLSNTLSTNQSTVSTEARPEEPEEVNLLTLTFGRGSVETTHTPGFESEPESDLPVCELLEENEDQEEEYDTQTGYMSR